MHENFKDSTISMPLERFPGEGISSTTANRICFRGVMPVDLHAGACFIFTSRIGFRWWFLLA